mmetsp:Transcript_44898/g.66027  ORF Transcript_44898/g.66027 Transcript_44898/m.66027 type:complete len:203 (-) Transcript_44898:779-1387(-)
MMRLNFLESSPGPGTNFRVTKPRACTSFLVSCTSMEHSKKRSGISDCCIWYSRTPPPSLFSSQTTKSSTTSPHGSAILKRRILPSSVFTTSQLSAPFQDTSSQSASFLNNVAPEALTVNLNLDSQVSNMVTLPSPRFSGGSLPRNSSKYKLRSMAGTLQSPCMNNWSCTRRFSMNFLSWCLVKSLNCFFGGLGTCWRSSSLE